MDRRGEGPPGRVSLSLAQVAFLQSDYSDAIPYASAAVRECLNISDMPCEQQARRFLNILFDIEGRFDDAIWESEKAFELSRLLDAATDQVKAANSVARNRLFGMNDIPRALEVLDLSAGKVAMADPVTQMFYYRWRAEASLRLGFRAQALLMLREVASKAAEHGETALGVLSEIESLRIAIEEVGRPADRESTKKRLYEIATDPEQHPANRIRADLLRHLIGTHEDSAGDLQRCVQMAREHAVEDLRVPCETELIKLLSASDLTAARRQLEKTKDSLSDGTTVQMSTLVASAELRLVWKADIDVESVRRSLELLAVIERRRARQRIGKRSTEFLGFLNDDYYWLSDQIVRAVQNGRLSTEYLRTAVNVLESARTDHRTTQNASSEARKNLESWAAWRRLRLAENSQPVDETEFRRLERPEVAERNGLPATIADIAQAAQRALGDGEALVLLQWHHNPAFGRGAFLLTQSGVSHTRIPNDEVIERALTLLDAGIHGSNVGQVDAALATLSRRFREPLLAIVPPKITQLSVVPDGDLHGLPLAAIAGDNALLSHATIFGSMKSWLAARSEPKSPIYVNRESVAVFAAPMRPQAPIPGTTLTALADQLPASLEEAEQIRTQWPGTRVLTGSQASETAAIAALTGDEAWLHIAAHVRLLPEQPLLSSIQLAPDDGNDGWLTVGEIAELDVPGKIIILSACESGSGRRLSGEGLIGLTSALLDAGATAVAANLWPVDDAYAATFITRWYNHLSRGENLTGALAKTQDDFVAAGYPSNSWAGWILVGQSRIGLAAEYPANGRHVRLAMVGIAGIMALFLLLKIFKHRRHDIREGQNF